MQSKIKRTLALLLVVTMTIACFSMAIAAEDQTSGTVPITLTASTPAFNVTVPTTLPIHMDAYGNISCGDATITNNSVGPVLVSDTRITAKSGWTLVNYSSANFGDADMGLHKVALHLDRKNGVTASGTSTGEDIIPAHGGTQQISTAAKIPYQEVQAVDAPIAQVVFVLGWYKAIPVDGITITGSDFVYAGDAIALSATKSPPNATSANSISWRSSNTNIASVSKSGLVTGVSSGTATITALCDGVSATKTITVFPSAPNSMSGVKLTVGGSFWNDQSWPARTATRGSNNIYTVTFTNSLSRDAMDQRGNVIIPLPDGWRISNPQMRVVSTNGSSNNDQTVSLDGENGQYEYYFYWPNFSGPSLWAGDYTFTVTYTLERVSKVYLRSLTISGDGSVNVGSTIQLSASKFPANTTDTGAITWSSNNTAVATVDTNGLVTAKKAGTAVITASCNGIDATREIQVDNPITYIEFLDSDGQCLPQGNYLETRIYGYRSYSAHVIPESALDGQSILISSSNTNIAYQDGPSSIYITGQSGEVTITVTCGTFVSTYEMEFGHWS